MKKTDWRRGSAVDDATQERLRALIRHHGEEVVAQMLGINVRSIVKAAAGGSVRDVTEIAIKAKLDEVEQKKTGT